AGTNEPAGTRTQDLRINLPHGLSPADVRRCGLDFIISPSASWSGAARKVSEDPACGQFPADCPIRRIVTQLLRTDGSQGVPAYGAVLPRTSRSGHSVCEVRCSTD